MSGRAGGPRRVEEGKKVTVEDMREQEQAVLDGDYEGWEGVS